MKNIALKITSCVACLAGGESPDNLNCYGDGSLDCLGIKVYFKLEGYSL